MKPSLSWASWFLLCLVVIVGSIGIGYRYYIHFTNVRTSSSWATAPEAALGNSHDCLPLETSYLVEGNSMSPLLEDQTKVKVQERYYECGGTVHRDDVVIYVSDSTKNEYFVKRVRALPGDSISSTSDGQLTVNGAVLVNSKNEAYNFSKQELFAAQIYAPDGRLREWAYLIYGDNLNNSVDSRKFWAVGISGFRGKVIP